MKPVPRRHSLIDETAGVLRQRIGAGEWCGRLPGEIELAALLQIGRHTLRAALEIMTAEGLLRKTSGRRREIAPRSGRPSPGKCVVFLMAKPVREFPPATERYIEAARVRLESEGWAFRLTVEPEIYRSSPGERLQSLSATLPGVVWILHRSTPEMQRWFQNSGERAVLAGSRHEGIELPQVELDYRAISRHAAGRFLARGHRRLAILRPEGQLAGDSECVAAFREAAGRAEVTELRCRAGTIGVTETLSPLLRRSHPVTGLFVLHADHCATALTFLQRAGVSIPGAMSLICRDDAPYLELLCPEPTRYHYSIRVLGSRLAAMVLHLDAGATGKRRPSLVLPRLIEGETLGGATVHK